MKRHHRRLPRLFALLSLAAVGLAPGCTLFEDWPFGGLSGTPLTLEQPVAAVTVEGGINVDESSRTSGACSSGKTLLWGLARNTGDVDVDDVSIVIETYGAAGDFLGSFSGSVYGGTVTGGEDETSLALASTSLAVDTLGSFQICTSLPYGSVARTEYRTDFISIDEGN